MTLPWTHAGLPVISLPCGKGPGGLSLGLQCVGEFGADPNLFRAVSRIEVCVAKGRIQMMSNHRAIALDAMISSKLLDEAKAAALCAYAPYSNFRVGAAVLGQSGRIYRGANVENASLGLGTCAERVALASAIADGERNLVAIAVACVDAPEGSPLAQRAPCGACRQWIQELAPHAEILILGESRALRISDLLPMAFYLGHAAG